MPSAGTYNVTLLQDERYFTSAGQRVFNVLAEGVIVVYDLDVFVAAVWPKDRPCMVQNGCRLSAEGLVQGLVTAFCSKALLSVMPWASLLPQGAPGGQKGYMQPGPVRFCGAYGLTTVRNTRTSPHPCFQRLE